MSDRTATRNSGAKSLFRHENQLSQYFLTPNLKIGFNQVNAVVITPLISNNSFMKIFEDKKSYVE